MYTSGFAANKCFLFPTALIGLPMAALRSSSYANDVRENGRGGGGNGSNAGAATTSDGLAFIARENSSFVRGEIDAQRGAADNDDDECSERLL